MKPEIFGAVARRLVNNFNRDSGLSVRNRILIASCLFQLARASQELTAESIDLWIKSIAGKVNGFSQIRLTDVCREFAQNEPTAFRNLWKGNSEVIYETLTRYETGGEPYREILRLLLFAIAEDFFENGHGQAAAYEQKIAAERSLTSADELDVIYLKVDLRRFLNMEVGELAFSQLTIGNSSTKSVEVEVIM